MHYIRRKAPEHPPKVIPNEMIVVFKFRYAILVTEGAVLMAVTAYSYAFKLVIVESVPVLQRLGCDRARVYQHVGPTGNQLLRCLQSEELCALSEFRKKLVNAK